MGLERIRGNKNELREEEKDELETSERGGVLLSSRGKIRRTGLAI